MDQAKESIGFRSFSQLDPRIEYKREGAQLFEEMFEHIQDRVSDLVFKARMQISIPQQAQQQQQQAKQQSTEQPRKQAAQARPELAEQSVRAASVAAKSSGGGTMTVGRNEPCPCGSGKKYKKCCGKK
jgi:preprotein translocase subunit SecA